MSSVLHLISPYLTHDLLFRQVQELTSSNTQKAALVGDLLGEVQQKTERLQEAHSRIEELEQRIELLEVEKAKSVQVGRGPLLVDW